MTFAAHFLKAGMRQICALTNGRQVEGSLRIRTVVDRRLEAKIGGDSAVQVSLDGSPAELRARIEEYQAAGVGHLVVCFEADDLQTTLRDMRRLRSRCRRRLVAKRLRREQCWERNHQKGRGRGSTPRDRQGSLGAH